MNNIIGQILNKIVYKTNKNEIDWKQSIESNCYEFSTSNMTIKLEKIFNNNPFVDDMLFFSFIDNKGEIFERVDAFDYFSCEEVAYEFYDQVKKQVNKVDEKLNTLLNELDDDLSSM